MTFRLRWGSCVIESRGCQNAQASSDVQHPDGRSPRVDPDTGRYAADIFQVPARRGWFRQIARVLDRLFAASNRAVGDSTECGAGGWGRRRPAEKPRANAIMKLAIGKRKNTPMASRPPHPIQRWLLFISLGFSALIGTPRRHLSTHHQYQELIPGTGTNRYVPVSQLQ